ncbi:MAG: PASTA domain-containing protein [Candidatus Acidiferrales bacterium]
MTLVERLQWILRMALVLFILASVAFLSALMTVRIAVRGREVAVPDVVGKSAGDAQQILQGRGIGMKVEDRIYNDLPLDAVVRQSPLPNMTVKTGQNAHVVLSLGPQKQNIPRIEDMDQSTARIALLRGGMQVGEISAAYLPGEPPDAVLQQDPAPGTTDVNSPHVSLLVSLGPRPVAYLMPELSGLPLDEAESKLSGAGLKVSEITPASAPGTPQGIVVGQTPTRGERVDADTAIELQVGE